MIQSETNTYGTAISPEELFRKKRVNKAIIGMILALVAGIAGAANGWFSTIVQEGISTKVSLDSIVLQTISILVVLGMVEFGSGFGGLIVCGVQGKSIKEFHRVWKVKSSRILLVSAFLSGPVGTGACLVACLLCGATFTYTITALAPVVCLLLSRIFLKEKANARMIFGIVVVVGGAIVSCIAPPEGITNLLAGIICAIIAAVSWALDAVISAHGYDTVDAQEALTLYRCWGSGIMDWIVAFIICIATGSIPVFGDIIGAVFSNGHTILFFVLFVIGIFGNYICIYSAFGLSGAARSDAIQNAMPFWTIPLGLFFANIGVIEYAVTPLAITGACMAVIGVILIACKPSELFNLRDI